MTDDESDDTKLMPVILRDTRTEYVTKDIHIHRAPTDESVKILKDMEKAAEDKVLESVKVGDTTFECVVHRMMDYMSDQIVYRAVFKLNGRQQTAEYRANGRDKNEPDAWRNLRDEIAKVIATHMISDALKGMPMMGKRY